MRISDWSSDVCSSDLNIRSAPIRDWDRQQARNARGRHRSHLHRLIQGQAYQPRPTCSDVPTAQPSLRGVQHTPPIVRRDASRSEEHTSELQSLMSISYAVFCLKKKKKEKTQ